MPILCNAPVCMCVWGGRRTGFLSISFWPPRFIVCSAQCQARRISLHLQVCVGLGYYLCG